MGASVVYAKQAALVEQIGKMYPGRASAQSILDLFITLGQLGEAGYRELLERQRAEYARLIENSELVPVLNNLVSAYLPGDRVKNAQLGAKLYTRGISGARLDRRGTNLKIGENTLTNFGTHGADGIEAFVCAASIGAREGEAQTVLDYVKQYNK